MMQYVKQPHKVPECLYSCADFMLMLRIYENVTVIFKKKLWMLPVSYGADEHHIHLEDITGCASLKENKFEIWIWIHAPLLSALLKHKQKSFELLQMKNANAKQQYLCSTLNQFSWCN